MVVAGGWEMVRQAAILTRAAVTLGCRDGRTAELPIQRITPITADTANQMGEAGGWEMVGQATLLTRAAATPGCQNGRTAELPIQRITPISADTANHGKNNSGDPFYPVYREYCSTSRKGRPNLPGRPLSTSVVSPKSHSLC